MLMYYKKNKAKGCGTTNKVPAPALFATLENALA